jgi:quinone-modifying oxidoreductase subunit QmoC
MSDLNTQASLAIPARYKNNFLKEVEERVEDGHWVKMCMQCGVCAGSCPFGPHWEHSPQKLFMMIRAGKREEVLKTDAMWMCTSCYNCIARCPRKLPITHIMHGLANYSYRLGLSPKGQPNQVIAKIFWNNAVKHGRVNELTFSLAMYFKDGIGQGIKNSLAMQGIGLGLMMAKRLNPMEILGGHTCKDKGSIHKMIAKACEIEDRRRGLA